MLTPAGRGSVRRPDVTFRWMTLIRFSVLIRANISAARQYTVSGVTFACLFPYDTAT
jgi:hypothetical protein